MKELKLDLGDALEIITHPMHLPLIYTSLKKLQTSMEKEGLFFPRIPPINSSPYLEPYRNTEDWTRTNILPDTQYIAWVSDIKNPSSWAIYFGLVETETEPNILVMKRPPSMLEFTDGYKKMNDAADDFWKSLHRLEYGSNAITSGWQNPHHWVGEQSP